MDERVSTRTVGITFFDGLLLLLIAFKLAGIIAWPWWAVIGLPFAILAGCILAAVVLALIVALIGKIYLRITRDKDD